MLKQEEKRPMLKPFVLAYQGEEASQVGKKRAGKHPDERLRDTRKVIRRVVERVKRI